ncbi:MAG TPA: YafY family protein [Stenotrophobium sp.]|nr:YafY family protein [Stenotrophobium sp.]
MLTTLCQYLSIQLLRGNAMRRGDRLFEIIQLLRSATKPLTASSIAETLEVASRTVYRDIAALQARRVPIEGAPGLGYVLRRGFDLPPLMFTMEEVEAIDVGVRLVRRTGDAGLQQAAESVLSKVAVILPHVLREHLEASTFFVSDAGANTSPAVDLSAIRDAIRTTRKVRITYIDEQGEHSQRIIWPVAVAYYVQATLIAAWCELRQDYRHFRTDRIAAATVLDEVFSTQEAQLLEGWLKRPSSKAQL